MRHVRVAVRVGDRAVLRWDGHCRVGVWTTLDQWTATPFVTREAWGRLGKRRPKRLARVKDEVLSGALVRIRPEQTDGDVLSVSFAAEVAEGTVGPERSVGNFFGRTVKLPAPRRHGYRFFGTAPDGFKGPVARWDDIVVYLGDDSGDDPPPGACHFHVGKSSGFVAGDSIRVEAFVRVWKPAKPIRIAADGVDRADYRLVDRRRAAGFSGRGQKTANYGDTFSCERK